MDSNQPQQMYPGQVPQQQTPQQQPAAYSQMKKHRFGGLILTSCLVLALVGSLAFGVWAFTERDKFKNQTDQIVAQAVAVAEEETATKKDAEFAEEAKSPLKSFSGPSQFGSIEVKYPKTWAAYVEQSDRGSSNIEGYFHPGYVPATNSETAFALRVEVVSQPYDKEVAKYSNDIEKGVAKAVPISLEKVPGVTGLRVDGEVARDKQGSIVLFPLRDKTLKISTLSPDFKKDFNEIILKNLSFSP